MRIPRFFKVVMTYVTPVFLIVMMIWWIKQDAIPTLLMVGKPEVEIPVRWASRAVMLGILAVQLLLVRTAWRRRDTATERLRRAA
jgi:neurotransmitter:Na+ symporter, NSS family